MVSREEIRKQIKKVWSGEITETLIDNIKVEIERDTNIIIEEVIKDFKAYNNIRRFHHLQPLRRLSQPKIYKQTDDSEIGRLGGTNRHTNLSKQRRCSCE